MTIADSIWIATALLHRGNTTAPDFSVHEIIDKVTGERLIPAYRPGLPVYVSKHCVANKPPNPVRDRILVETARGRRRLFREGDPFHPNRQGAKTCPNRAELPAEYQALLDWYDDIYSKQSTPPVTPSTQASADAAVPEQSPTEPWSSAFAALDELQSEPVFVGANGTLALPERLRRKLGIQQGSCLSVYREKDRLILQPITEEFIRSLRGCCKGEGSLVEAREREHRTEK